MGAGIRIGLKWLGTEWGERCDEIPSSIGDKWSINIWWNILSDGVGQSVSFDLTN